jgi:dolichol-phosphate mannosyltransferase
MTALRKSANLSKIEPELSIVIPSFNEQNNLQALYSELMKVLPSLNMTWEIIFSDDGSIDNTWGEIASLHEKDHRDRCVRLYRNFGHQYADTFILKAEKPKGIS